jgi:pimeloyl-ACP methyl ester carboxylesterase
MTPEARTVAVWRDQVHIRVLSKGRGPAVVFFHGPWGLAWDPFLDDLARSFTVYAPEHPGTSPGRHDDIYHLDGVWDLALCHDELLEQLGIASAAFVGHSFGGMVACEVAAAQPRRTSRLVLIDALGLWRDDAPIPNWMLLPHSELAGRVFRDADGEAAHRMFPVPTDVEAQVMARVSLQWAMGATGKFLWPIPDKGLRRRIHRIQAPTLVVWGRDDRIVPPVYATEFARHIVGARVEMVDRAGHAPHLEEPEAVAEAVRTFLSE